MDLSRYNNKTIAVLMGGLSSERDISLRSGDNVYNAIAFHGLDVIKIDVDKNIAKNLTEKKVDIVFNALHGKYGEDGCIQGLLEILEIPYTGSGVEQSAIGMNKILTKQIWKFNNIPTAYSINIDNNDITKTIQRIKKEIGFPVILKPVSEGSSFGVRLIKNENELLEILPDYCKKFQQSIAETYIDDKELTVGLIGKKKDIQVFPILELRPKNSFYDYEAKYTVGMTDFIIPADIPSKLADDIKNVAKKAFLALKLSGVARIDIMLDKDNNYYFIEVNSIPGFTDTSDIPAMAKASGISFEELVIKIMDCVEI